MNTACSQCSGRTTVSRFYKGGNPLCVACRKAQQSLAQDRSRLKQVTPLLLQKKLSQLVPLQGDPLEHFKEPLDAMDNSDWQHIFYFEDRRTTQRFDLVDEKWKDLPPLSLSEIFDRSKIAAIFFAEHTGEDSGDKRSWTLIFMRRDGIWVYLAASCCYTGFSAFGGGSVTYSDNFKVFWNKCLDSYGRTLVTLETSPS